ncbi:MAG TPA: hypothetical protein VFC82_08200 [Actinomycetaceae bacterium]|nr:hypothetical protein [Actinomycetaceae bacterium]
MGDNTGVNMDLLPEEPAAGPWRAVALDDFAAQLLHAPQPAGRPRIVAVDGRGASGKSTLAGALAARARRSVIVHTDDVAWHEPFFAWGDLLADRILQPLHRGEDIDFRPPAWVRKGREGSIQIPFGTETVIIEGTGANQRSFAHLIDATVWVQADFAEAERRGIARDIEHGMNGNPEETVAFWHEWMSHEIRFFAADRPWERADVVVAGTATVPLLPGQLAVSPNL